MNRNEEMHFSELPTIDISRSKFDMSFTHKGTMNAADLVPVYVDCDIVPGDTVTMRQSQIIRMMTPIAPVMDNCYMDFYWFFVPNRLVWDNFKRFMGENDTAPWTQTNEYQVPQSIFSTGYKNSSNEVVTSVTKNSLANKMGIPQQNWEYAAKGNAAYKEISVSALPFRAYVTIWNEFFRDENLQNPCYCPKDDTNRNAINELHSSYVSDPDGTETTNAHIGNLPPLKVCKPHDYFTSCLPEPQKGPAVRMPLSEQPIPINMMEYSNGEWAPITAGDDATGLPDTGSTKNAAMAWGTTRNYADTAWVNMTGEIGADGDVNDTHGSFLPEQPDWYANEGYDAGKYAYIQPFVDMQNAVGATINSLRQAFAIQKFYEREARGGTRYIESVWSHFKVRNPDYRLQRPEYLGGFRANINMNQVVQNSATEEGLTPLGATGAYSVTSVQKNDVFSHSFTEHGILMGLCCIRTDHTYQQGINRMWFKKNRFDFYTPEFANLGEQAVLNQEIMATGVKNVDEYAFGYQERWAEMRYKPSIISGEMSSLYSQSLEVWHYGDIYEQVPALGDEWIQETPNNIERTLAVQNHDQFMFDFYFAPIYTRPLPLYSVPGLIDHH